MFGNTSHWCTCKSHDWLDNSRTYTLKDSLHAASWLLPHFRIILSSAVSRSCAVDFVSACTLQTSLPGTLFFSCKKRKKSKSALLMMRFFFFFNPYSSRPSPHTHSLSGALSTIRGLRRRSRRNVSVQQMDAERAQELKRKKRKKRNETKKMNSNERRGGKKLLNQFFKLL